jgi:HD superfamily phosphohydrolase YqeK
MISDDRLRHIIGVARECYNIAKERGFNEDFCKRMFMIGYLHDVGYEFDETATHGSESAKLLSNICLKSNSNVIGAIEKHGELEGYMNTELNILNIADLTIDACGNKVTVEERLADISERYGVNSNAYIKSKQLAENLKLL